ncbi:MAG: hypothetical protein RMJ51_06345 [Candidatus Calescibacterium sp.]|nr:hypothetical protein [Candidatus Calescibacterium sp.]MCX7971630.1 hypothetical protein [bacterium]MDW8195838.1 hypothetical protein [Candidatus Calescibacterium sp.]
MFKILRFSILLFIYLLFLIENFSYASKIKVGYEIDMRTRTVRTIQNISISYTLSEKYIVRLMFNNVDLNEDLFKKELNIGTTIFYLPNRKEKIFFILGKDTKNLTYSRTIHNYELEISLAKRRKKLNLDTAVRLNLSDSFTIKFGFTDILSENREFYIRPNLVFSIK